MPLSNLEVETCAYVCFCSKIPLVFCWSKEFNGFSVICVSWIWFSWLVCLHPVAPVLVVLLGPAMLVIFGLQHMLTRVRLLVFRSTIHFEDRLSVGLFILFLDIRSSIWSIFFGDFVFHLYEFRLTKVHQHCYFVYRAFILLLSDILLVLTGILLNESLDISMT